MDSFKLEKANAMSRYRRIQQITALFRVVELLAFLVIVSKFSPELSFTAMLSGEYLRRFSAAIISHRFVFLIGNAIVLVLFLKSGRFSPADGEGIAGFYDEYVEKCRRNQEREGVDNYEVSEDRKMCRSRSEKMERSVVMRGDKRSRELARSMTEGCRRTEVAEEMSSEEFRRTVEAFIARQQRFLREEE